MCCCHRDASNFPDSRRAKNSQKVVWKDVQHLSYFQSVSHELGGGGEVYACDRIVSFVLSMSYPTKQVEY